jgi:hypothetical protein
MDNVLIVLYVCVWWNTGNYEIGDEGIIRIAEGLEKNTSLEELDLGGVSFMMTSITTLFAQLFQFSPDV